MALDVVDEALHPFIAVVLVVEVQGDRICHLVDSVADALALT